MYKSTNMNVINTIYDKRIKSLNVLLEFTLDEYNAIAKNILSNNEFQRRRVKSSLTVYSLLKSDLKEGCVVPPIVLALAINVENDIGKTPEKITNLIDEHRKKLIILDGLQRTYTIRDLIDELTDKSDPQKEKIVSNKIRVEVYLGINKLGILYRMLTLNTGQTPMSSRHQIEIIYSDYLKEKIDNIQLIKEIDDSTPSKLGEYKFRDIIDGFTSYLERDYLTIDRFDILDNIKSLEKLATENQENNIFETFIRIYHKFVEKIDTEANRWEFDEERLDEKITGQAFGKNAIKIFNKSQPMTGFGSAIGKLIEFESISSIDQINALIDKIKTDSLDVALSSLIIKLDSVRSVAKKIGNDQRMYFHYFFRELFDKKSDGFLNFTISVDEAYRSYERKTL